MGRFTERTRSWRGFQITPRQLPNDVRRGIITRSRERKLLSCIKRHRDNRGQSQWGLKTRMRKKERTEMATKCPSFALVPKRETWKE